MKEIYLYLLTVPCFFAIDMLWLGFVAKKMYKKQIGQYMKAAPNWWAAILFYLLYIVGILIFAVLPNLDKSATDVLLSGLLFGFLAYSTYDLTNYSTLKDWPLKLTVIDIIWGTVLTGGVAMISYYLTLLIY